MTNPLLAAHAHAPLPAFSAIQPQHAEPALDEVLARNRAELKALLEGALMIAIYNLITSGGQTPVAPSRGSWTDLYSDSAVGTRGTVVKAHIRNAAADGGAATGCAPLCASGFFFGGALMSGSEPRAAGIARCEGGGAPGVAAAPLPTGD